MITAEEYNESEEFAEYIASSNKRGRLRRLIFSARHNPVNPLPKGFKDGITIFCSTKLLFKDRIRVLLGGLIELRVSVGTENITGHNEPFQTSIIIK